MEPGCANGPETLIALRVVIASLNRTSKSLKAHVINWKERSMGDDSPRPKPRLDPEPSAVDLAWRPPHKRQRSSLSTPI
jgi:hypothetical protein